MIRMELAKIGAWLSGPLIVLTAGCSLIAGLGDFRDAPSGSGGSACKPVDDGNDCTEDACAPGGTTTHDNKAAGSPCSHDGTQCDGKGRCVDCLAQGDCKGGTVCIEGACVCTGTPGLPGPPSLTEGYRPSSLA